MVSKTSYVSEDQLEIDGFKGPRRANRKLRGLKTLSEARTELRKMYGKLPRQERRRLDFYRYEMSIRCAIHNFIVSNNRMPSVLEIEYDTGISRTTIYNHLKHDHQGFEQEFQNKIIKLRKQALEQLYVIGAQNGNVRALTEFLKLTGQKMQQQSDNNFIQINNIYIDQRTIQNLPEDTKEKLELILLESAKVD